jgi:hypothetical protein
MMIPSTIRLVHQRTTRSAKGIRANSFCSRFGIFGSNFGATQIGVRW